MLRRLTSALAACSALAVCRAASAAPCSTLGFVNPIYGAGGSAITATLAKLAPVLRALPQPITVLYADPDACTGFDQFRKNTITSTLKYWNTDGMQGTCDPDAGQTADFSTMANHVETCTDPSVPADTVTVQGPAQGLNIIVPAASTQTTISAEALYFAYEFGDTSGVSPWNNHLYLATRAATSFASLFLAKGLGVDASTLNPAYTPIGTNGGVVTALAAIPAANAENGLGYVSGPTADANPTKVHTLAYQHFGQTCAYLPDSAAGVPDKKNIRDGQYFFWSYNQFFGRLNTGTTTYANPSVKLLFDYITGAQTVPLVDGGTPVDIVQVLIQTGQIPECAMRVKRDTDLGPLASYAPPDPCGCYFEYTTLKTAGSCTACTDDQGCSGATPKCRHNFCEAY